MPPQIPNTGYIVALDVGAARVGVAIASSIARLPSPLTTLSRTDDFFGHLSQLLTDQDTQAIVVGWPRGLQGQSTAQTAAIESFVAELKTHTQLPLFMQDEALTSQAAETELQARGKNYARGDIDALAATYILEYFLAENPAAREVRA